MITSLFKKPSEISASVKSSWDLNQGFFPKISTWITGNSENADVSNTGVINGGKKRINILSDTDKRLGDHLKIFEKVYNQLRVFEEIEQKCMKPAYIQQPVKPSLDDSSTSQMDTNSGVQSVTSSNTEPKSSIVSNLIKKMSNQKLMRLCQMNLRDHFIHLLMVGLT